jgi:hypothetical protein
MMINQGIRFFGEKNQIVPKQEIFHKCDSS